MPILLLVLLLTDVLTFVFIGFDIYFISEWYLWRNTMFDDHAMHCLYGAIAITVYSLVGSKPWMLLLSKVRKQEDEPREDHGAAAEKLQRPDGTVINIEFAGNTNGSPLLFVHGINENTTVWYYQKKYFEKKHRLILIDLPGMGRSKGPNTHDYSLPKMAADLNAVIEHLNLSNLLLWGHSIGGMVILTYCCQVGQNINQRIKGIILQNTTYTDPTRTGILSGLLKVLEKPVFFPLCYIMIALWPLLWVSKWMSYFNGNMLLSTRLTSFAGTQTHAQLDFICRQSAKTAPSVFGRGMLGMMKTYNVTPDLKNLAIPSLVLSAKSDIITKPEAGEFIAGNIPDGRLVILAPAGHQSIMERHAEGCAAAEEFISGLN